MATNELIEKLTEIEEKFNMFIEILEDDIGLLHKTKNTKTKILLSVEEIIANYKKDIQELAKDCIAELEID